MAIGAILYLLNAAIMLFAAAGDDLYRVKK